MARTLALSIVLALAFSGCSCGVETRHATLRYGAGLAEGSPVVVSGIEVGHVTAVHLQDSDVEVAFVIDGDADITLHEDGCALALPATDSRSSRLVVLPGDGAPRAPDRPLEQCRVPLDGIEAFVASLGEGLAGMRDTIVDVLRTGAGMITPPSAPTPPSVPSPSMPLPSAPSAAPVAPVPLPTPSPSSPLPPLPVPSPASGATGACANVHVRVERIERVDAVPLHLPEGGARVYLVIENGGDGAIELSPVTSVTLVDLDRRAMTLAMVPGAGDWFMPIDVAAHASAAPHLTIAAGASDPTRVGEIAFSVTTPSDPFTDCTVTQTFVAP